MQLKALTKIITALAILAALSATMMPVISQGSTMAGNTGDLSTMFMPQAVLMTIAAGGPADGNTTFTVPHAAKVYNIGNASYAAVATYSRPLQGMLNASSGTGMINAADVLPATAYVDYQSNVSIPVAGAKAVVVMRDFSLTGASAGTIDFDVGALSAYMPDGTIMTYNLTTPVKMGFSLDSMTMTVQANPELVSVMSGLIRAGPTFPADAQPVRLNTILAAV